MSKSYRQDFSMTIGSVSSGGDSACASGLNKSICFSSTDMKRSDFAENTKRLKDSSSGRVYDLYLTLNFVVNCEWNSTVASSIGMPGSGLLSTYLLSMSLELRLVSILGA